ncbi:MAG: T9SS type A sorting domain-containing protein [Polaribacter sp.]
MHVTPDNDRCINTDRQRNEIKTYDKSPDNLLGVEGEEVVYKWKFKLDSNLQLSSSFTHVHQLKSVGGSLASMPMYTLTLRKSTPDRLELRYAETTSQTTLKQTDLAPLKGSWLEVTETITYGESGAYSIEIKKVSDNTLLFDYTNNNIINWRVGTEFVRPKWGIYRSLNSSQDLRDEEVLFANFSIEEINSLSINNYQTASDTIEIYPNPVSDIVTISQTNQRTYDSFVLYNILGQEIIVVDTFKKEIDISFLTKGIYTIIFKNKENIVAVKKLIRK